MITRPARLVWGLGIVVMIAVLAAVVLGGLAVAAGRDSGLTVSGVIVEGMAEITVLVGYALVTVGLSAIGAVISSRVSHNQIGWLLLGLGTWLSLTFLVGTILAYLSIVGDNDALAAWARWVGSWTFIPLVVVPLTFALLVFPDGRLPSPRWGILRAMAGTGMIAWMAAEAFRDTIGVSASQVPNQFARPAAFAVADALSILVAPALVGSVAALVVRFRRSQGDERQQIKWVALAGAVQSLAILSGWLLSVLRPTAFGAGVIAAVQSVDLILVAAISFAILKYRLYDIDRLISRTVAYALVVGLLVAVYVALAIGLPRLLGLSLDSPLLTAGATLAVAGLFRPITSRVQVAVDRRFNRARYDAQREVDVFSTELAHRVDLGQVVAETTDVVRRTVQPNELGVWIR